MQHSSLMPAVLLAALSLQVTPAFAEAPHANAHHRNDHPHHLSVFVGETEFEGDKDKSGFTLGIDYEYRVNDLIGLGTVAEYAYGDIDALTVLAVADIHITHRFIIQTGPGYEWVDNNSKDNSWVYRVGALYEFNLGRFTVSPQAHWDFHDATDDALVLGLAVGMAF